MGLSHRIAFRIYAAACRAQRRSALLPLNPAALAFLKPLRHTHHHQPPTLRLLLLGVALVLLLLAVPLTTRPHLQEGAKQVCGAGGAALLTACVVWLYNIYATMDDQHPGGWRWQREERDGATRENEGWKQLGKRVLLKVTRRYLALEVAYLKMKNLTILVNQLVFFCVCERLLMGQQKLASLYTLIFFDVVAYCVSYIKELVEREDWTMYVNIARTSNVRHLAMSTTKIALEWTKAVTFIITVVFMLLVFGLEEGLKDYSPTPLYLSITVVYFTLTEKVFTDMIGNWIDNRKLRVFESLESLYWPVLLLTSHFLMSSLLTFLCIFTGGSFRIVLLSSFTNIRVKYRELRDNYLVPLRLALATLSTYRVATQSEVQQHDDVCAVCLTPMTSARVTPCQHFFHADCLRRCLKESYKCPICQYNLSQAASVRTS
ncbi:hypothetical protein Pmani_014648 [Petrolisthes manimaculis]|uniref:RING-type domain-containing protein n=1 Tax=Petrolisthes manimaculis TaxID=1843537 RepID=A0AAE1UCV6_9EUCA|nr:hypothetical protein Pmani_014648 [Petrolisthes manimaculis]